MQTVMKTKNFEIVEFQPEYQERVEQLVLPIQQIEFGVPITRDEQKDLVDIVGFFRRGCGNFWVALQGERVVGTIGIMDIGNNQVALKKMFVAKEYRGKEFNLGGRLMEQAKLWCNEKRVQTILLGTTEQMTAAQRFYEKHGFVAVAKEALPSSFPLVHQDSRFYRCDL